ncbi:MAG: hypothetical protein K2Z81_04810 [Cyanobacteria bacterium]|nr:hypothetical protein [Cyanobacteriota bacterium]
MKREILSLGLLLSMSCNSAWAKDGDCCWAQRMASFTAGVVVGTPVAIVKRTYQQTRDGSTDLIGDSKNPILVATTTAFALPFAIFGGPIQGVEYSIRNSWIGSREEPFGKTAFSIDDAD